MTTAAWIMAGFGAYMVLAPPLAVLLGKLLARRVR